MKPKEFYCLTIREYELMCLAHKRKIKKETFINIENWKQARMIAYNVSWENLKNKNMTVYDFMPLPNDPTEKDIEKAAKAESDRQAKWMKGVITKFREKKIL